MLLGGKGVDEPLDASNVKKSIELVGVEGKDNNYVERSSTRPSIKLRMGECESTLGRTLAQIRR